MRYETNKPSKLFHANDKILANLKSQYSDLVNAVYVRHILLETEDMANFALEMLYSRAQKSSNVEEDGAEGTILKVTLESSDPFGTLAKQLSACQISREEGGKIGWIDNPFYKKPVAVAADASDTEIALSKAAAAHTLNESSSLILPHDAIAEIFTTLQPKTGDIHLLKSTRGWHLLRIDDLFTTPQPNASTLSKKSRMMKGSGKPLPPLPTNPKTYFISTVGCQMNVSDSERMEGVLQQSPLSLTPALNEKDADVVVLNTCSIRDHAESKLYDRLGPLSNQKQKGKQQAIVVAGCVAQQEGEELLRRIPEIDVVMGPQYIPRMSDLLTSVLSGTSHQVVATDPTLLTEDLAQPVRNHAVRAWVNVLYGCNEHCTYCVVPHTRGVEQSRSMESILSECQDLARRGYREVTLLGQNVDAYGRDLIPQKRTFADLLIFLNQHLLGSGLERIRYVTSHPRYFSPRVVDAVANLELVCECFHVPFQSGDDDVLKYMRRGYTFDSYMRIIDRIKNIAGEDASICGDVIVGFPGETDEAFENTLRLMEAVKFDNLNTFAYSPRPNTEAAHWTNQVPEDVKSSRLQQIQRLATQHATERSARYLHRNMEVLVEERNPKIPNQVMGRTRQGRQVFFEGDITELLGRLVNVKILETRPWSLTGEMVVGP